ncbi:HET-domain-containing protein [Xylariaceae sp. AK1471]|nr:HET-domain-containing protein [Xylariaceae sp. AK1471]
MDYTNPHSCQHCERILLFRPEDDPDLHEGSEPRQSLLLLRMLRALRDEDPVLRRLEHAFLLEVNPKNLARFVSDGCLFYKFISTGLEKLKSFEERGYNRTRPGHGYLELINGGANQRQDRHLISVELEYNAVKISAAYVTDHGDPYFTRTPQLLHDCTFGVSTEEGSSVTEKFESIASINISSEQSFARARSWLENCVQNHPQCSRLTRTFTPARLIKILTRQGRRLIHLKESDEAEVRYAALSYCWGGEQDVRTTKQTFPLHCTQISFQDLPRTIQDAVIVTENLGIQYLWIDALCIIQDDEEDRAREIDLMGHVYENAEVTIVASRAERAQEGFLQDLWPYGRDRPDWVFKMRYRDLTGQLSPVVIAPTSFRTPGNYLSKRAWAFQERLFSNRILEYSSTCVHWSCQSHRDCDRQGGKCSTRELEKGVEILRGLPDRNAAVTMKQWHKLVDMFSQKSLTIAKDRLPAIAGIAERFGLLLEVEYLAGIWRSSLPNGLLWIVDSYATLSFQFQPRPSTFLAPSWSWASTTQPIKYSEHVSHGVSKIDVIRVDIGHQANGTTYGAVNYGHLTLRGFITPIYWKLPRGTDPYLGDGEVTREDSKLSISICRDAVETSLAAEGTDEIRAYLLVLVTNDDTTRVTGLVLHRHHDQKYSRLGIFDVPYCTADQERYPLLARSFLEGNPEEVTII